jgi:hypothetical protein
MTTAVQHLTPATVRALLEGLDLRDREHTYAELRNRIERRWADGRTSFTVAIELQREIGLPATPWWWETQSGVAEYLYRTYGSTR